MTQKQIGPSFVTELNAAGLAGLPFSYSVDGYFTFGDAMTEQEISAVNALYEAHDPDGNIAYWAAVNTSARDSLLSSAALRIAPLQDAVDLETATDEEKSTLEAWKQYRVSVMRTDLGVRAPSWPSTPA
ncbi:tail fiber assembly protein [Cupriavidus basilensis]|uniref:tail fiber assembly protein n=1 Tax=Cupriavidus basilensis TaxID=68895 RepID=UPI0026573D29|nr:tail fiber assembly protein [Cupriavidus basilensis]